jgi:hypothetical protein
MKAEDVLLVLNELEPVNLDQLEFCVITGTMREDGSYWPFEKAEIIVVDKNTGREPFGEGRKPAKWDVDDEHFDTLSEAMECRQRVLAGTWRPE